MNTPKITVTDNTYSSGAIGFRSFNSTSKFKNVTAKSAFDEDFKNGDGNWSVIDGTWSIVTSQYNVDSGLGYKSIAIDTNFGDFTYEADVNIIAGDGNGGLIFRCSNVDVGVDAYFGYYAGLDSAGNVILGRANGGDWLPLSAAAMTIQPIPGST